MNNKVLLLIYIIIFMFFCYCGIDSKNIEIINSMDFFTSYFDSFQKYLFIGTLIMIFIISVTHIDYMKPEIRIRLRHKVFEYVWRKYIINSILITVFIILLFTLIAFICNYDSPLSILNINCLLRILSFNVCCYVICECIYLVSQNKFLSIAGVVVLNFSFLVLILGINFYIMVNSVGEDTLKFILTIYNLVINVFGIIFFYFYCDKKELIK